MADADGRAVLRRQIGEQRELLLDVGHILDVIQKRIIQRGGDSGLAGQRKRLGVVVGLAVDEEESGGLQFREQGRQQLLVRRRARAHVVVHALGIRHGLQGLAYAPANFLFRHVDQQLIAIAFDLALQRLHRHMNDHGFAEAMQVPGDRLRMRQPGNDCVGDRKRQGDETRHRLLILVAKIVDDQRNLAGTPRERRAGGGLRQQQNSLRRNIGRGVDHLRAAGRQALLQTGDRCAKLLRALRNRPGKRRRRRRCRQTHAQEILAFAQPLQLHAGLGQHAVNGEAQVLRRGQFTKLGANGNGGRRCGRAVVAQVMVQCNQGCHQKKECRYRNSLPTGHGQRHALRLLAGRSFEAFRHELA